MCIERTLSRFRTLMACQQCRFLMPRRLQLRRLTRKRLLWRKLAQLRLFRKRLYLVRISSCASLTSFHSYEFFYREYLSLLVWATGRFIHVHFGRPKCTSCQTRMGRRGTYVRRYLKTRKGQGEREGYRQTSSVRSRRH